jgi:hypothetical protein
VTKTAPQEEADRFARTAFRPDPAGRVYLRDLRARYHSWCAEREREPLPDHVLGAALNALFASVGLYREGAGAEAAIPGIAWTKPSQPLIPRDQGRQP